MVNAMNIFSTRFFISKSFAIILLPFKSKDDNSFKMNGNTNGQFFFYLLYRLKMLLTHFE